MKALASLTAVVIMLSIFSSAAMAECKKIKGRATAPMFESPCGEFELCITNKTSGTLAGESVYSFIGNVLFFPADPDSLGLVAEVVWHTDAGDVFGTNFGIIDFRTFNVVDMTTITSGTGKWEGATGQVLSACDANGECDLHGQICRPKRDRRGFWSALEGRPHQR